MTPHMQHENLNIPFLKMNGAGNDFMVLDARKNNIKLSIDDVLMIADREFGIGCDQLIVLTKTPEADVFVNFHNADGSHAGACGNGTRCIGGLLIRETGKKHVKIATKAGILEAFATDVATDVQVNMGLPKLEWQDIPLSQAVEDTANISLNLLPLEVQHLGSPAAASMGNPHVVFFVESHVGLNHAKFGQLVENFELFPERVNVNFAQIISPAQIRLVVWERGTGLTAACGTGACATAISAMRRGLTGRKVLVQLPGGALTIEWQPDDSIMMTGPISFDFEGIVKDALQPALLKAAQ